jgi:hypothetical protein
MASSRTRSYPVQDGSCGSRDRRSGQGRSRPSGRKIELEHYVVLGDQALEAVTHLEGGGRGVELGVDHGPLVDDFADGLQ